MAALVGRDLELAELNKFLSAVPGAGGACIIEGDAGTGKTALWRAGCDAATALPWRVLAHRPAPADVNLAMVGLSDLLDTVEAEHLDTLASPLRSAVEVILLRREPGEQPTDPRTVATAVTELLRSLARDGPVLVAIDDSQWLDSASARALAFAARRVADRPIGWLVTARRPEQVGTPLNLDTAFDPTALTRVEVGPLSVGALFHVVQSRTGITLSRPMLLRIHKASGGNPLFAVELASSLGADQEAPAPAAPLRVPASLRQLLDRRIASVSPAGRAALLVAAAAHRPRTATVVALSSADGLAEAEQAGIVQLVGDGVVFDHPLLASAVYDSAGAPARRAVHRALAGDATEPEERGRHMALASPEPSDEIAATIDAAAAAAHTRGAPDVAADLAELALARTIDPNSEPGWRRRLALADYLFESGSARRALDVIGGVTICDVPDALQVRALRLQTIVAVEVEGTAAVLIRLANALESASGDMALRAEALILTARVTDDRPQAAEFARAALDLLELHVDPDPAQLAEALHASAGADFYLGRGLDRARFERAIELEERSGVDRKKPDSARAGFSALLKYADCYEEAHEALIAQYHATLATGDESSIASALAHLPQLELWLGNWPEALRWADEHYALAQQTEQVGQVGTALGNLALVEAHFGELERARAHAAELLELCGQSADRWGAGRAHALLGFVALSAGDAIGAVAHFDRWWDHQTTSGQIEPGYGRSHGDYVEALVGADQVASARATLDVVEPRARAVDRASSLAAVARGRALVAAATGDLDAALAYLDEALGQHARADVAFERARTLLVKGQVHRRRKEKLLARTALEASVALFDHLGAAVWLARARDELGRVNIRPAAPLELTATERRVAELAASGLTNRQVADAAFISPKTVEANLARVYRKLGISSRAELGQRMSQT